MECSTRRGDKWMEEIEEVGRGRKEKNVPSKVE
jgi:hypothetical protein